VPNYPFIPIRIKRLESSFDKKVAAVILEPIRGEGGGPVPSERYITEVGKLCKKKGSLLIMDEIFLFLKREVLYKKSCPASSRSRI
jgi:acetylornithine/succinyldiaminopimelate/putrescine aminotransferase